MRFMVQVRATPETEAGVMPEPEALEAMGAFNDELIKGGHCIDDKALTGANEAVTLRFAHSGTLAVTDGPFAETKEQLGGVMLLEATDLNHAIQLMSRLPCMRVGGSLEIRPINEEI